ncbi:MAG: hypothetical protein M0Z84_15215, partial [Gammaproteobacteria bacterium]|nr:hypothetical protein [Gammaproteobacteria bacterium]
GLGFAQHGFIAVGDVTAQKSGTLGHRQRIEPGPDPGHAVGRGARIAGHHLDTQGKTGESMKALFRPRAKR